jgi:catechol 2,3-dioxygenase-like lactoylglutathione lyase family enzyme
VRARGYTHVSVSATDLEESVRFYTDFFGMEEVPSPEFSSPVRWLRVGDLQLHLFLSEDPAPARHHFALDVDDFEAAYRRARETGARVQSGNYSTVRELPVLPSVEPGELTDSLPASAPDRPEAMERILQDFRQQIVPAITHWNHPRFHAYFPASALPGSRVLSLPLDRW